MLALFALLALFFGGGIPRIQPAVAQREADEAAAGSGTGRDAPGGAEAAAAAVRPPEG